MTHQHHGLSSDVRGHVVSLLSFDPALSVGVKLLHLLLEPQLVGLLRPAAGTGAAGDAERGAAAHTPLPGHALAWHGFQR